MNPPPLPDIDLARIAPLPAKERREALAKFRATNPPLTYRPFRSQIPEILNSQTGLHVEQASLDQIKCAIIKKSLSDKEEAANIRASKAVYDWVQENEVYSHPYAFSPLSAFGHHFYYWCKEVPIINGKKTILFIDPRRNEGLKEESMRFVFSVMHQRIRLLEHNFHETPLGVMRFNVHRATDQAVAVMYMDTEAKFNRLFDLSDLNTMIRELYDDWRVIYQEQQHATREEEKKLPLDFGLFKKKSNTA